MTIVHNGLTPQIYSVLREKVDFMPYSADDVSRALQGGLFSVVIFDTERPAACARVVGDGRIAFFIKDVVVDPDYQGLGLGNILMAEIDSYLAEHACENAYVGLMSTPGMEGFYEKFGFIRRPNTKQGAGMIKYFQRRNA